MNRVANPKAAKTTRLQSPQAMLKTRTYRNRIKEIHLRISYRKLTAMKTILRKVSSVWSLIILTLKIRNKTTPIEIL